MAELLWKNLLVCAALEDDYVKSEVCKPNLQDYVKSEVCKPNLQKCLPVKSSKKAFVLCK